MSKPKNLRLQTGVLQQMSYYCPGLHGPGTKMRVERRTFDNFLLHPKETKRVLIPLFQRRYCWEDSRVFGWWNDVVRGKRDHLGIHNSGNVVVKRSEEEEDGWIVIDGQQRFTTTNLLAAALRDAFVREGLEDKGREVVEKLEAVLYEDVEAMREFVKKDGGITEGTDLGFCRLLPSFSDRQAFFKCIMEGRMSVTFDEDDEISLQRKAKSTFDAKINEHLTICTEKEAKLIELRTLAENALQKMGLTLCEVQNEINMPQVFLWLQEKTLFGEAAMLYNPTPGIDFCGSDLVRNLVLSSMMGKTLAEQEEFYRERWLFPVEKSIEGGPPELTLAIGEFVDEKFGSDDTDRHVSAIEELAIGYRKKFPLGRGKSVDHITIYSRFYSFYESRLRRLAMLPPMTTKDKADKAKVEEDGKAKAEEVDLGEKVGNDQVFKMSMELLEELVEFFKKKK